MIVVVLGALLVAGAAPPQDASRHAVAGRYDVMHPFMPKASPDASGNAIANTGFETGGIDRGWFQCGDVPAYATEQHPYAGEYDAYSGTASGSGEPMGNSGVCQRVTIPPGALLTARLYRLSNEPDTTVAYQEADLVDERGDVVVNLYKTVNDRPEWVLGRWNLDGYAGRRLWIYFGVHGDGYAGHSTQQFVDDVTLTATPRPPEAAPRI